MMKGKTIIRNGILLLTAMVILMLSVTGCRSDEKPSSAKAGAAEESAYDDHTDAEADENTESKASEKKKDNKSQLEEGVQSTSESLAKRMCGKYSCHIGSELSGSEETEVLIMDVIEFGDNLYAFCGRAMEDDQDDYESYSFWVTEFIPDEESTLKNADSKEADVTALNFSIMSNAGKYWDTGVEGTITLTDEGLVFEGFDNDGFLVPEHEASRMFVKDDRAEDAFPYLRSDKKSGNDDIQGLWVHDGDGAPVYLRFSGSNMYVYRKSPDKEVYYAAGGCNMKKGSFSCRGSVLGNGNMPYEWNADYKIDDDELCLWIEGDELLDEPMDNYEFRRADEKDIHVITMDEVVFNDDSFGSFGVGTGMPEQLYKDGFYGVWVMATKDQEEALETAKKLSAMGYDSCVCYSPEWEALNQEAFYCVATGSYTSESEAEDALAEIKTSGYKTAYVKYSGKRKYVTINYYNFGTMETEVYSDKIILRNVKTDITRSWYKGYDDSENQYETDLIIDKNTVFDDSCETEYFGNYEEGDTPFSWYIRNYDLMDSDPDKYMLNGPALSGVFEVGINGNHIDRFFGSYWWD